MSPLQHLGECDRRIQNTHCLQLIRNFHQRHMHVEKVIVNAVLLKIFCKEDTGVDATIMRHVQRVLVQDDDSNAR